MALLIKLLTVVGLGVMELWAAIPAGLALGLPPVLTGSAAALGAVLSVLAVVFFGEKLRTWLVQRHNRKKHSTDGPKGRIYQIWERYGAAGLGLLSPLLFGAPLGAALGLTLGAPASRLLFWMIFGIVLWSAGLTFIGTVGLAGITSLWR